MKTVIFVLLFATLSFSDNLPNRALTPGSAYSYVSLSDICKDWYRSSVPSISSAVKRRVFERYGIKDASKYVVDRLVSAELGGNNSLQNLWPQRIDAKWSPEAKNELGKKLHHMVCYGELTLKEAQQAMSENWIEAYKKYVGELKQDSTRARKK